MRNQRKAIQHAIKILELYAPEKLAEKQETTIEALQAALKLSEKARKNGPPLHHDQRSTPTHKRWILMEKAADAAAKKLRDEGIFDRPRQLQPVEYTHPWEDDQRVARAALEREDNNG